MTVADEAAGPAAGGLRAITFDFGNTLVPVSRAALRSVIESTASGIADRCRIADLKAFLVAWAEERDRQFREEVPRFREVDLEQRVARVLARCRGMPPPGPDEPWDDRIAAERSTAEERAFAVDVYSRAFVAAMPATPGILPLFERLSSRGLTLAILSNWPLAATIDRYAEAAGWLPYLAAVIVSQRVGTIKPRREIFDHAAAAVGASGRAILHVGDDWAADVVGARGAGWRVAYLRGRPGDSPLPSSQPDPGVEADLTLDRLEDLEAGLDSLDSRFERR